MRDDNRSATALTDIAQTELQVDQYDSAEVYANQVLRFARANRDRRIEVDALRLIGDAHQRRSRYDEAERLYLEAIPIAQEIGDSTDMASLFHNLANVYADQGRFSLARTFYTNSLRINQTFRLSRHIAESFLNIGIVDLQIGESAEALIHLDSARVLFDSIGDRGQLGTTLGYIGTAHTMQGNYTEAKTYFQHSIDLAEELRDTFSLAIAIGNLADVYTHQAEYARGIKHHLTAGNLFQKIGSAYNVSACYLNVGGVYFYTGEYERAIDYYRRSWKLKEQIGDQYGIGLTFGNLGSVYLEQGILDSAEMFFERSLQIGRKVGDSAMIGRSYESLAEVKSHRKSFGQAEELLRTALTIFHAKAMESEEAQVLNRFGDLLFAEKKYVNASQRYEFALALGTRIGEPDVVWKAHTGLGRMWEARDSLARAAMQFQQAIGTMEQVRLQIGSSGSRASYLAASFVPFESLTRLCARMHRMNPTAGYDNDAFLVVERSKARSFLDALTESHTDIRRGVSSELKQREETILHRITRNQSELMSGTVTDERKRELIDQIQREQENLQQCESEIRLTNPLYGALKYPPPIDLRATQQLLGDTTLLVNFSLGSERSFVWIVSHSSTHLIELPASSSIEKHVYAFLKEIRKRPTAATCTYSLRRIHQLGRSLFQMLLGETAGYLAAVNQLIIVPDGILHYLPFEALTLPTRLNLKVRSTPMFLGELVPVGYVQSATVLAHLRNVHPIVTPVYDLLAFGDPTFSSLRKSQGDSAFLDLSSQDVTTRSIEELGRAIIPLPSTRSEVQQIGALFPPERVKLCLGADATERRLKSEPLASYRFIHFATHGVIDENAPGLSGLLLSTNGDTTNDGFLQANEIFNLDLNADVVVLSACETGLGKLLRGEGMIGLTRAFQYAGARSVVVSLWKVADASTAAFMTRVYTSLATGKSPASALHDAKAVMLCSPVALWHHPFHWAGFVVEGGL